MRAARHCRDSLLALCDRQGLLVCHSFQGLPDVLLAVHDLHLDAELLMDVLCQMLCTVDAAMLTASTAETKHQTREPPLDIARHMMVGKGIDMLQKLHDLAVVLKEAYHRLVESRQFFIRFIASGIVRRTAVEDIAASIARGILRDSLFIGEAIHAHHERSFAIVFRECGQSVLWILWIDVAVCGLETIFSRLHLVFLRRKLRQVDQSGQHFTQIGIGQHILTQGKEVTQILDSWRYAVNEVLLMFEVATEAISAQHLQSAEENEETQPAGKVTDRRHFDIMTQGMIVLCDEITAQLEAVLCRSLPQERSQIVIVRAFATALEVDEERTFRRL